MLQRTVKLVRSLTRGTCHFDGVARCGLVWECPDCSAAIKAERAADLARVLDWHRGNFGREGIAMLTLTVAHDMGDDMAGLVTGIARAWKYFIQGREWRAMRERLGFVGSVRALEVTLGPNGAHPHLHVLLLTRLDVAAQEWFRRWAFARWRAALTRAGFAPDNLPDSAHGASVTRSDDDGSYLTKLGLEISAPNTKRAKGENRTPLDLLAAFVNDGDADALRTYRQYVRAMKGHRQLTYSRGLLAAATIAERTDQECAEAGEATETVVILSRPEFRAIRRFPGAATTTLELCELYGPPAVYWFVAAMADADPTLPTGDKRHLVLDLRRKADNWSWLRK